MPAAGHSYRTHPALPPNISLSSSSVLLNSKQVEIGDEFGFDSLVSPVNNRSRSSKSKGSYYTVPRSPFIKPLPKPNTHDSYNNDSNSKLDSPKSSATSTQSSSTVQSRHLYVKKLASKCNIPIPNNPQPTLPSTEPPKSPQPQSSPSHSPPHPQPSTLPSPSQCAQIHAQVLEDCERGRLLCNSRLLSSNRPPSRTLRLFYGDLPQSDSELLYDKQQRVLSSQSEYFLPPRRPSLLSETISQHLPQPKLSKTYQSGPRKEKQLSKMEDIFLKEYDFSRIKEAQHSKPFVVAPVKARLFECHKKHAPRKLWIHESEQEGERFAEQCKEEERRRVEGLRRKKERKLQEKRENQREFLRSQSALSFRDSLLIGAPFQLSQYKQCMEVEEKRVLSESSSVEQIENVSADIDSFEENNLI
ncbi:hypothetical protein P9112_004721 [Eukaryota sp. TZLM1-RC]